MLKFKRMATTDQGIALSYTVWHNVGLLPTTLDQPLDLVLDPQTGKLTGQLVLESLTADDIDQAREKLAEWCDRMAAALRQPMRKVSADLPIFERVPFEREQLSGYLLERYDALVAEWSTFASEADIQAGVRAFAASKHPLVYVADAVTRAAFDAALEREDRRHAQ